MAIRAAERKVSDIEYENTYTKLYRYLTEKVQHIPKRHLYYIGQPMNVALNGIYEDISICTDLFLHGKGKEKERHKLIVDMLPAFAKVMALSYYWWNLSEDKSNELKYVKANQREFWCTSVNKELALLGGVAKKCGKAIGVPAMRAYTKADIRGVMFLEHLQDLQILVYKRALKMPATYRDARMELLVKLTQDAFYNALEGNSIVPEDDKAYKQRKKYISDAVGNLFAMNRPVRELAFTDIWSEGELSLLCNLVNDTLKMLKAVQASDKERFSDALKAG